MKLFVPSLPESGGGGLSLADASSYTFTQTVGYVVGSFTDEGMLFLDPNTPLPNSRTWQVSAPGWTTGATDVVCSAPSFEVDNIPLGTYQLFLQTYCAIYNAAGTQVASVSASATAGPDDTTLVVNGDFTFENNVGSDLTFDGSNVHSTAGGVYAVVTALILGWND